MFTLLYTFLTGVAWLLALPLVPLLSLRSKYRRSLPARFLLWKNPPLREKGLWFHVCSFGEARAIRPLAERFDRNLLRLSSTTQTGYNVCRELAPKESRYLPFEPLLWSWIRPQKALVVMEAELWYLLFHLAKARGAATFLINARISDRSWANYRRFAWFYRQIFARIDRVFAQTERDRERLEFLGAKSVRVVGNIKVGGIAAADKILPKPEGAFLVCGASTHEGEEGTILEGFHRLKSHRPDARLVMVPRHPERFDKVARMMESFARLQGWSFSRFSVTKTLESDLVLMDRMGELVNCYAVSDLVVLGGSFVPVGGHNAAEAAQFGIPILSGPHTFNQREIFAGIEGISMVEKEKLPEAIEYPALLDRTRILVQGDPLEAIEKELQRVLH
ncbi:lipid IV(A) 3-deoxy-D-manno-octulosonic acid transferase [Nitratifractor sp.]